MVVLAVLGYQLYKERQKPTGIEINVGKDGLSSSRNRAAVRGSAISRRHNPKEIIHGQDC